MANAAKLEETIGWAEMNTEPAELYYDQDYFCQKFSCGTAMCIAGIRAWQDGWILTSAYCYRKGVEGHIPNVAQESFGLTPHEAIALFYSKNSLDDVKRISKDIINGDFDYEDWKKNNA